MSFRFHFGRPQQFAALVLALFFAEALFVIGRAPLTDGDYRYALCGREMWEATPPVTGYFTTCGNMQGDGSLAYRAAGLPVSVYVQVLRLTSGHAGDPNPTSGSIYDLRHQISGTRYLIRVPFALAGVLLGGCLWWVTRRLFGNLGGAFALGLYAVSPPVLRYATTPNNEVLAAFGMFAAVYTAIGIGHAMYGPTRRWRPRIALYTVSLGLTACAHLLAAAVTIGASALFLFYVAQKRRTVVIPLLLVASFGAGVIVLLSYNLHLGLFLYAFTAGAARFTVGMAGAVAWFTQPALAMVSAVCGVAVLLYATVRRSRYFGNTAPLLMALALLPIMTGGVATVPALWAYPFALTFAAGVFADALETSQRKMYLAVMGMALLGQVVVCALAIAGGLGAR